MVERVWALQGRNLFGNLKYEDPVCVYQPGNPTTLILVMVDTASSAAKQLSSTMFIK